MKIITRHRPNIRCLNVFENVFLERTATDGGREGGRHGEGDQNIYETDKINACNLIRRPIGEMRREKWVWTIHILTEDAHVVFSFLDNIPSNGLS